MAWSYFRLLVSAAGRSWSGFGCQPPALLTEASCGETMSDATTAAVIVIVSVGVVISYPSLMYPPLRTAAGRALWVLAWPLRAVWRLGQWIGSAPAQRGRLRQEGRGPRPYTAGESPQLPQP